MITGKPPAIKDKGLWLWFGLLAVMALLIMVQQRLALWQDHAFFYGEDLDPVLRLLRVEDFAVTGNWANEWFTRVDPPHGMVIPWTYPMDVILFAGGWFLHHWMPWRDALLVWGVMLWPIEWLSLLAATLWAAKPWIKSNAEVLIILILFLLAPQVNATFAGIRSADHHGMALIAMAISMGMVLRSQQKPQWLLWAGAVAAFGFWIAIEGFLWLVTIITVMGIQWWLGNKNRPWLTLARIFITGALPVLLLAWLIEQGASGRIEHDRLSVVHVTFFCLSFLFLCIMEVLPDEKYWQRSLWAVIAAGAGFGIMQWAFPGFYQGPSAQLTPWMRENFLQFVGEMQPWQSWHVYYVAPWFVAAALFLDHSSRPDDSSRIWFFSFLLYTAMTAMASRLWRNAEWLMLVPLALAMWRSMGWAAARWLSSIPDWWRPTACAMGVLALLFVYYQWPNLTAPPFTLEEERAEQCDNALFQFVQFENWEEMLGTKPMRILAPPNVAINLVYWTPHDVFASNYSRNDLGYEKFVAILRAEPDEAKRLIQEYDIGAVIYCPQTGDDTTPSSFGKAAKTWLNPAALPPWLAPVAWDRDNQKLQDIPVSYRPVLLVVKKPE